MYTDFLRLEGTDIGEHWEAFEKKVPQKEETFFISTFE